MPGQNRLGDISKAIWSYRNGKVGRRDALRLAAGAGLVAPGVFSRSGRDPARAAAIRRRASGCLAEGVTYSPSDGKPKLSDFEIYPERAFRRGQSGEGIVWDTDYDKDTHRYARTYVHPQTWTVRFDAWSALQANLPGVAAVALIRGEPISAPSTPGDWVNQEISAPDPEPPDFDDGGAYGVPENFVSYLWHVVGEDVDFELLEERSLPICPTWTLVADLPREGVYRATCYVKYEAEGTTRREETTRRFWLRDFLVASIGDSFASGEGNPDLPGSVQEYPAPWEGGWGSGFFNQCEATTLSQGLQQGIDFGVLGSPSLGIDMAHDPVWLEPEAHRSLRSWHARAAAELLRPWQCRDVTVFDLVTFVSVARSGATIYDGLIGRQHGSDDFLDVGQLSELKRTVQGRAVDALLISIGGNDAGFAGVLTDLVANDLPSIWKPALSGFDFIERDKVEREVEISLQPGGDVDLAFDALAGVVKELQIELPIHDIFIATYPLGLFETTDGGFRSCELFEGPDLDISSADAAAIERMGLALNDLIRGKADKNDWHVVDIEREGLFREHGYCAPDRYWVHAEESCEQQGNFDGTMHPNDRGHKAYAFVLHDLLKRHVIGGCWPEELPPGGFDGEFAPPNEAVTPTPVVPRPGQEEALPPEGSGTTLAPPNQAVTPTPNIPRPGQGAALPSQGAATTLAPPNKAVTPTPDAP
jgi:hypothetical protein